MGFPKPYRLRGIEKKETYTHPIVGIVLIGLAFSIVIAVVIGIFTVAPIRLT